MIEFEKIFLAKALPTDLHNYPNKDLLDIYVPVSAEHPNLRIRKNGHKYEITKKSRIDGKEASMHKESTIKLREAEYADLSLIKGKRVHKQRYIYNING